MRRISRHALRSHDNLKRIKIRRIAQTTSWSRATRIDSANTPPRTTRSHDVFKVDYLKATQLVHLTMLVRTQLMAVHVRRVCQVAYCHIRSIAKIRKCLTTAACKTIVHALVMSRVDYGNALLFGLPEMQLHKLQMIQNSAAWLVTGTHGRDHITPVLFKLHWLPVRYRIEFKLLVLVYQAVHHLGPAYLTSLVTPYAPTRTLRSAAHRSLTIPRYNLERYGRRAFSVAGPSLWNNLPVTIREAGTLTTFKSTLKTHLFRIAFKAPS